MMTADLLPKGVLQTFSSTGTKDSSNVSATTPMQKPALQPHKGTEALQPLCPEQSATELKPPNGKHSFYAHLMSIINVHTHKKSANGALSPITRVQILMHTAYDACFLLMQVLHCVLRMLIMALCTLMPLLTTSTWLFISMYATALSVHTTVIENRQPSKCVSSPQVMQICVILVSLLSITANLTMFILTQVHCMLTLTAAYSFLAQPHWNSACLILLYAPGAIELTIRLTHVIQHAIQSPVKNPKQTNFTHPRIRNGTYWRRSRNRTRRLHKQPVYRYIKVLYWLHYFIQQSTPQQPKCSKEHASQPNNKHCTHMQGEAKCDKTQDRNAATQHKPDHCRGTHSQKRRAAHHRRTPSAVIRRRNKRHMQALHNPVHMERMMPK